MEPIQESVSTGNSMLASEMRRAEMVAETLGVLRSEVDDLAGVAHDACNMLTALSLYCELLEEPGVLRPAHRHYVDELRMVATSGRKLVEKLTGLRALSAGSSFNAKKPKMQPVLAVDTIRDFSSELKANRNLLSALAGTSVSVEILSNDCHLPARLTGEDLTRILVNLVKNACEAMPQGGKIEIAAEAVTSYSDCSSSCSQKSILLTVNDTGTGIPLDKLNMIFESGFTTKGSMRNGDEHWTVSHRGLGLAIVRSLIEEAGGAVRVESSIAKGTRFVIELPTVAQ